MGRVLDILETNKGEVLNSVNRRIRFLEDMQKRREEILGRAKKGQSGLEPDEVKDMTQSFKEGKEELKILNDFKSKYKRLL